MILKDRQKLEESERRELNSFAVFSGDSHKRIYSEAEHPYRTCFQRDRDRIVHCSAFRRLEYKTQVFVNHEGDYYRTRLTHSLEVAQVGKTIAKALGVNELLTEAICLAHDLGHTPFGHAGEEVMKILMEDFGGFEHNRQSFKIVTELECPSPLYTGLNLTLEVLEGLTKHQSEYDMPDGSIFARSGAPTIEAQIGNLADEIAYNNHDLDDGLKSGLIQSSQLMSLSLWRESHTQIKELYSSLTPSQERRQTVRRIINALVTDLIEQTAKNIVAQNIKTLQDVRERGQGLVGFSAEIKQKNAELKKFLFAEMYRHYRVERMASKAKTVMTSLFKTYIDTPGILPKEFVTAYKKSTPPATIVCDYIAGMTDRFALEEFQKLFDPFTRV